MTASAREDPDLLAACSNGDEQALGALYDRYSKPAYGVALRVLRDSALAEDAVQDAFVTVWREAATYTLLSAPPCRAFLDQMRTTVELVGDLREEDVPPEMEEHLLAAFRDWRRDE